MAETNTIGTTKLVEFFGLPRTGKTTCVNAIQEMLLDKGIKTSIAIERASACPIRNKMHPLFNYWTAIALMREYIEACDKGTQVLLADRGILDSFVWLDLKNCDGSYCLEAEQFQSVIDNVFVNSNTIVAFLFVAEIDVIVSRDSERKISPKPGLVTNAKMLNAYLSSYNNVKTKLSTITKVIEIDTTSMKIHDMIFQVFSCLEKNLPL